MECDRYGGFLWCDLQCAPFPEGALLGLYGLLVGLVGILRDSQRSLSLVPLAGDVVGTPTKQTGRDCAGRYYI